MLKNKVVVITGASSGLGRSLAFAFAKEGAKLAICARGEKRLLEVQKELQELGADVLAVTTDVADTQDVDRFISLIEERFHAIDVLINNASIFGPGPSLLVDYLDDAFQNVLRVNTVSVFLTTKRVLPGMLMRNSGSIINVTSEAGQTGFAEWGAYGISKFALEGLTETWADELSETDIRVNMVDPGEMDTPMHEVAVPDCDYELGNPDHSTNVFLYLADDSSKNVHGKRFEAQRFQSEGLGDL
ncbi:SDR family oxidoreductase [Radiobacillus kanasensis]|uniref:SDR family NAD(P)-dependent oxidoreductase n=1 Tax=Radiobacillus kanasensis TaxID=2844358 RepID=UPI001E6110CD|nr:SDR family oxidoreductase [Radiobacillus kanasensis]UFT99159.1 SDR family oxidoreductase [Radiobacillus kanasensis]